MCNSLGWKKATLTQTRTHTREERDYHKKKRSTIE